MIAETAFIWSAAAIVLALVLGVFLIFAYRRIRKLEVEVRRVVSELSKLERC